MNASIENSNFNEASQQPNIPPPLNTPSSWAGVGATTAPQNSNSSSNGKRIVNSAEDLVLYTDADSKEYPIYIADDREIWLKAKPHRVAKDEDYWITKRVYDVPVLAVFFVKDVGETNEDVTHPLLERTDDIIRAISKGDVTVKKLTITYEVVTQ